MSIKIMIIEDDLIIAENLKENLEDLQYIPVGVATNYKEAVILYKTSKPDLCLVDIYLKGSAKNGIETIKQLVKNDEVPIIYLTSFDDTEFREKAKETNPSAYLIKPASKKQLDVAIDFAISNFNRKKNNTTPIEQQSFCPLTTGIDYFFIKNNDRYQKILFREVVYLKAAGSYCQIVTTNTTHTISISLKNFLQQYNNNSFIRCHRTYAVSKNYIQSFDDNSLFVLKGDEILDIPISGGYKVDVLNSLPRVKTD